jgi:hypothetical protein
VKNRRVYRDVCHEPILLPRLTIITLSGENLIVEFLPLCSRELFELAYVLGVKVRVILDTIPGTCR